MGPVTRSKKANTGYTVLNSTNENTICNILTQQNEEESRRGTFMIPPAKASLTLSRKSRSSVIKANLSPVKVEVPEAKQFSAMDRIKARLSAKIEKRTSLAMQPVKKSPSMDKIVLDIPEVIENKSSKLLTSPGKTLFQVSLASTRKSRQSIPLSSVSPTRIQIADAKHFTAEERIKARLSARIEKVVNKVSSKISPMKILGNGVSQKRMQSKHTVELKAKEAPLTTSISKDNVLKENAPKLGSSVKKVPDFASIHKRAFDKMESIVDHSERKIIRAKELLSGHKVKGNARKKLLYKENDTTGSKPLPKTRVAHSSIKDRKENIINKRREQNRDILKGVRKNRQFELLMKYRKINN